MYIMNIRLIVGAALIASLLSAQTPPAAPAAPAKRAGPNDVVATIEGEKITPARLQQLRESLPPQFRQAVSRMDNRSFLRSYAELLALSRLAEKAKTAEQEPYKAQFDFVRMNFLAQTYMDQLSRQLKPSQDDFLKYYSEHKSEYEEAQVRAIFVSFSPSAGNQNFSSVEGKKPLTEEAAKTKIQALWEELKKGADFVKLAKENSDDKATAEKGGEAGPIKRASTGIPAEIRNAVFALKAGEITEPIRQPTGFYIFKLEGLRTTPFEEVVPSIAATVQGMKMREELDRIRSSIKITYDNESFFNEGAPSAPPAPAKQ